jgi:maleylacetoacetate isomerase
MNLNLKLYSYWRSSASYRIRIALNLKALKYETVAINLLKGEQFSETLEAFNPQHMVPVLVHGERIVRQSLAIMEYLEESFEDSGYALLTQPARERARIRSIANLIATDIAPINVLRVVNYLAKHHGFNDADKKRWTQHWIIEGFNALESLLDNPSTGTFCEGDEPTMADCCLVPQVYNALRWDVDITRYPKISGIYQRANEMPEFQLATPEQQPDAT